MPIQAADDPGKLTISLSNTPLSEAIKKIEAASSYTFFYDVNKTNLEQRVSLQANDLPVEEAISQLLKTTDLTFNITNRQIALILRQPSGAAQARQLVSGTVVDEFGEPVIGANIIEKGTLNGVITNIDGEYSLSVPGNAVLQISYIGYITREINVANRLRVDVQLDEDSQALDEVIVIGYGVTKRKDFTGSVSSLRMENSPVALASNLNALEAIKGNIPGLNIGATNTAGGDPSMQLRGQKSISGSNDPLIVVDGVIYMGGLGDINPNDIASFDILKDATSAAAYGSRSANGVIMITTKRGKTGKPVITLNASGSVQSWWNRPKLMNGEQWLESVMARNSSTDLSWMKPQEVANMEAGREIDWLDESTRTGFIQDYQLSVSGAGEKMNYYLSTAYSENKGVVVGDRFDRISILGKINTDITGWLQIGADAAYTRRDYSGVSADLWRAIDMSPYGVLYRDEENKLLERYPFTQSGINPLWESSSGTRDHADIRDNYRLNAYAVVSLPWVKGLSYRFNYALNSTKRRISNFYHEGYFIREGAYDDETRYSPEALQNLLSNANGSIETQTTSSWVVDNILTYSNTFGRHSIDLTAVSTRDRRDYEVLKSTSSDYSENGNTLLGYYGLPKGKVQKVENTRNRRSNIGYLARASYSFDDRYFLTASFRRDGASVFGANHKWGNFLAFGGAWRISNETFMESATWLDDLKIKLSWGKNGNQGLDPYGTLSTVKNGASGGTRYQFGNSSDILYGLQMDELGNADLGWEATQSWNGGFESALFRNRLFVDVDMYYSKTTDQIFKRNIPVMTGFKTIKSSMGQIDNKGIEVNVRSVNIETADWRWTTGVTFWLNRNKLVHLYGEDLDGDGKEDDDIANSLFIGKPLGAIYGYVQDGIVQETDTEYMEKNGVQPGTPKYKDLDGDGEITPADRTILGYQSPNFYLNMSHTVSYKNWDLYFMLTGTFGGGGYYLKENQNAYMVSSGGGFNTNGIYIPWWTPENKSNVYPAATFWGDGRFQGLQNRGFVRLQDITLSYTFREPWVKSMNIQQLKLFVTAKNLFTITNWDGGDPEVGTRVRDNTYPVLTSFSLGATISF
ncbi:MAG: TonB-dependent receptor [Tannerellaceae bacterium]|nr:TonB-dependent receptor [Tannerellaceae bacterium]